MVNHLVRGRAWMALAAGTLIALMGMARAQDKDLKTLKIGTTGSLAEGTSGGDEKGAMTTLHDFVKSETGFENEINNLKGWQDLGQQLADGKINIGVFQGYEFAWAKEKFPKLEALTLAVNGHPYRYAHVVVRKDSKAQGFASLKG